MPHSICQGPGIEGIDKLEEPPSLVALKAAVAAHMPLDGFTHANEGGAWASSVATGLCTVLLAEACNTGSEPLIRHDNPACADRD